MATFGYKALTSGDRLMTGTIEAGSHDEAAALLEQMELNVSSLEKAKAAPSKTPIGRNEFLLFNQQLASITKAGIPLERGLRELADDVSSRSMRKLIKDIADELEAGVSIEKAFEKRQRDFPPLYGRILKAGVETGRLSEMLTSLNRHLELAGQTRRIIFEAVTYPAVVLGMGAAIITLVFVLIIPQFKVILQEMIGGGLPDLTRLFLALADNIIPFWIGVAFLITAIVVVLGLLSASPGGRRFRESILYHIPVMGRVYMNTALGRFSEATAMMVAAGCDMPTCLRLGAGAAGSENLMADSEVLAGQIEQGQDILEAGRLCSTIPRLLLYSVQLGAQRNELQDNLFSLSQMYANQARYGQARLQSVLLPLMIVVVGSVIAMAVVAMILPMVQVLTNLAG